MPVGGKKDGITRRTWMDFATYCGLREKPATRVLREIAEAATDATVLVGRSRLPDEMKASYVALLRERARVLAR